MSKLMNNTGKIVDIFNLQKDDVASNVIILGACRINRFLGQTLYAYPVAAHLIGGYWYLESVGASDTIKKQWLIHEAFESYSGVDLPSPLKAELPLYKEAEQKALKVIAESFGVEPVESDEIKTLDRSIMVSEALTIMPNSKYWIEFAKTNNIEYLSSAYVLNEEQCCEKNLKAMLTSIWNKVFIEEEKPTIIKLRITGVVWTNELTLTKDLPNIVDIEVDGDCFESAKAEGNLSDFLKFKISEDFVFTPIKLGKYRILA